MDFLSLQEKHSIPFRLKCENPVFVQYHLNRYKYVTLRSVIMKPLQRQALFVDEIVKDAVDECSIPELKKYFKSLTFSWDTRLGVSSLGNIAYMLLKINDATLINSWDIASRQLMLLQKSF